MLTGFQAVKDFFKDTNIKVDYSYRDGEIVLWRGNKKLTLYGEHTDNAKSVSGSYLRAELREDN